MDDNDMVMVCASCLQASCWLGEFYCDDYKTANITELPVWRLRELDREHPDYWQRSLAAPPEAAP